MSAPRRSGRRLLVGGLLVVVVVLIAAVIVRNVFLRDQSRAVPTDEALEVFREEAGSTSTAPPETVPATVPASSTTAPSETSVAVTSTLPPMPDPGIYRYQTTGTEEIDALDGASHQYPAETTITMVDSGCGVHVRWDALRERRDEWGLCSTASGVELQTDGVQYHEFFGQPNEEAVACDHTVLVVSASPSITVPVQPQSCTLAGDPWKPSWDVLERTTRTIGGAEVAVQHVRMTIDDNDEFWEHTVVDWYLADTGLPVEVGSTKESRTDSPIGGVVYRERYHLLLVSMIPLQ